ncbi:MAG: hypothetical protein JJ895_12165 [Balneolaceae bacterium]|nr:hypothetical protein [Balneolaceae bacterium]
MRSTKKGHATAKQHDLNIGNRKSGTSNLSFHQSMCNAAKDGRNLAFLVRNSVSGLDTIEKAFNGLKAKYEPFLDEVFRNSFDEEIERLTNE